MADADVLLLTNVVLWPSLTETTPSGSAGPRWIEIRDGRIVHDGAPGSADDVIELMKQVD